MQIEHQQRVERLRQLLERFSHEDISVAIELIAVSFACWNDAYTTLDGEYNFFYGALDDNPSPLRALQGDTFWSRVLAVVDGTKENYE